MIALVKKALAKIAGEPLVTVGVVYAAVNSATDQSWLGYGAAAVIALLRFAVTPTNATPGE